MIRPIQIIYCLLIFLSVGVTMTSVAKQQTALCLKSRGKKEVLPITERQARKITGRYKLIKSNECIDLVLSSSEMEQIEQTDAARILVSLMSGKNLPTFSLGDLIKAAIILSKGQVDMTTHGEYFAKLLGYEYSISAALNKTIQRQKMAALDATMVAKTIASDPNQFVSDLKEIGLDAKVEARFIKAFGLCANGYLDHSYCVYMRRILIEKPIKKYDNPVTFTRRAFHSTHDILQDSKDRSQLFAAFRLLANNINKIASDLKLNDFNKACMAKCIADEMLTFRSTRDYPFLTPSLLYSSLFESGAKNMAQPFGMCLNYATITSTLLKALNFSGKNELAMAGLHFFNVVTIDGQRYHFHPMRKYGRDCSFFPIS